MFEGFDEKLKVASENEIFIDDFENCTNTETEKIVERIVKCAGYGAIGALDDPEIFWMMLIFVNQYRLKEPRLGRFLANIIEHGLVKNAKYDEIVNYYFSRDEIIGYFSSKADPWILRWMVCEFIEMGKRCYRLYDGKLVIFEVNDDTGDFMDLFQKLETDDRCSAPDRNFKEVIIHDPFEEIECAKKETHVLYALLGMLPGTKVSIPGSYHKATNDHFIRLYRLIDRNGNFNGITSLAESTSFLKTESSSSSLKTMEQMGTRIRYLCADFSSKTSENSALLSYIRSLKLERIRISISHAAVDSWDEIWNAIPCVNPDTGKKVVVEKLTIYDFNDHMAHAHLERLKRHNIEFISLVKCMDSEEDDLDGILYRKVLSEGTAEDGKDSAMDAKTAIPRKSLYVREMNFRRLDIAEELKNLPIETLILDLENSPEEDPGTKQCLKTIFQSERLKCFIINLIAAFDERACVKAIRDLASKERMRMKVVLCVNYELEAIL